MHSGREKRKSSEHSEVVKWGKRNEMRYRTEVAMKIMES